MDPTDQAYTTVLLDLFIMAAKAQPLEFQRIIWGEDIGRLQADEGHKRERQKAEEFVREMRRRLEFVKAVGWVGVFFDGLVQRQMFTRASNKDFDRFLSAIRLMLPTIRTTVDAYWPNRPDWIWDTDSTLPPPAWNNLQRNTTSHFSWKASPSNPFRLR